MNRAKYTESAGGIVVHEETGDVLIVNQNFNSWSFPKGHIDSGEDPLTAAKREIFEESGIVDMQLVKELGKYKRFRIGKNGTADDESEIKTILLYLFTSNQNTLKPIDPHNPEAKWVSREEAYKTLTHEKDREFFKSVVHELPPVPEKDGKE